MTDLLRTLDQVSFEVFNGFAPRKGPRSLPITIDFSLGASQVIDLALAQTEDKIEFVQSVYVDNAANTANFTMTCAITGQVIIIPPGNQAFIPLLCPNTPRITVTCTASATVTVQLLSFPVAAIMWNTSTSSVSGLVLVRDAGGVGTDYSANAATALANLLATIPVSANRNGFYVQNQSANQVQVALDDGAGGAVTYVLLEGGGANTQGADFESTQHKGRVRIYGSSSTQQVGAREW
ncbi:MAG TPA: DUF1859 domain-containing protein [Nitrosomonas sp.]|nr:DUF1859 domain-containing protein [Nitrosomonas sp.]